MVKEIDANQTTRAAAFELWMAAPNPMVTLFKTLDVSRLVRLSKKKKLKFNMLLIGNKRLNGRKFMERTTKSILNRNIYINILIFMLQYEKCEVYQFD